MSNPQFDYTTQNEENQYENDIKKYDNVVIKKCGGGGLVEGRKNDYSEIKTEKLDELASDVLVREQRAKWGKLAKARKWVVVQGHSGKKCYHTFVRFSDTEEPVELPDVEGIEIHNNDAVLVRKSFGGFGGGLNGSSGKKRGKITRLSEKSLRRMSFVVQNTAVEFKSMITLTYPEDFPTSGRWVKEHLDKLLKYLRRGFKDFEYFWFFEFQGRGAPHLHILVNVDIPNPCNYKRRDGSIYRTNWAFHKYLSRLWYIIVGSGDKKHLKAGISWDVIHKEDGAKRYVSQYASKPHQKQVPEGFQEVGRFWGCSHGVSRSAKDCNFVRMSEEQLRQRIGQSESEPLYKTLFGLGKRIRKEIRLWKWFSRLLIQYNLLYKWWGAFSGLSVMPYLPQVQAQTVGEKDAFLLQRAYRSEKTLSEGVKNWLREAIFSEYEGLTIQEAARKLRKIAISANVIQA